ncbi:MAG: hypothetical protein QM770_03960 [Tepidisphaeraceae bacterium]
MADRVTVHHAQPGLAGGLKCVVLPAIRRERHDIDVGLASASLADHPPGAFAAKDNFIDLRQPLEHFSHRRVAGEDRQAMVRLGQFELPHHRHGHERVADAGDDGNNHIANC